MHEGRSDVLNYYLNPIHLPLWTLLFAASGLAGADLTLIVGLIHPVAVLQSRRGRIGSIQQRGNGLKQRITKTYNNGSIPSWRHSRTLAHPNA